MTIQLVEIKVVSLRMAEIFYLTLVCLEILPDSCSNTQSFHSAEKILYQKISLLLSLPGNIFDIFRIDGSNSVFKHSFPYFAFCPFYPNFYRY